MQAEMPRSHSQEKPCADHHQIGTAQLYSTNFLPQQKTKNSLRMSTDNKVQKSKYVQKINQHIFCGGAFSFIRSLWRARNVLADD
jgi:hypothetical protein